MISRSKYSRHIFLIIAFLLLCGCESKKNEVFTNEPDGFRDYRWGTKFNEIEGIKKIDSVATKFDLPYYQAIKINENLDFYGTMASEITYNFEDDLLASVMVSLPSKESFEKVKEYCFSVYGTSEKTVKSKDREEYTWKGKKTDIKLSN